MQPPLGRVVPGPGVPPAGGGIGWWTARIMLDTGDLTAPQNCGGIKKILKNLIKNIMFPDLP